MSKSQTIETMPKEGEFLAKRLFGMSKQWFHVTRISNRPDIYGDNSVLIIDDNRFFTPVAWAYLPDSEPKIDLSKITKLNDHIGHDEKGNAIFFSPKTEGELFPDESDLNCPHCGGSGHKDDAKHCAKTEAKRQAVIDCVTEWFDYMNAIGTKPIGFLELDLIAAVKNRRGEA